MLSGITTAGYSELWLLWIEQLSRQGEKLLVRQAAVAVVHRLSKRKGNAGADADQRGLLDAELGRDLVGNAEADAADVAPSGTGSPK